MQIGRAREDVKYGASQTEGRGRGVSARGEENRRQLCPTCWGGKKDCLPKAVDMANDNTKK